MADCAAKIDIKVNTLETMRGFIEEAGFVNVHEKSYKWSHGPWVKGPLMKEIGRIHVSSTSIGRLLATL